MRFTASGRITAGTVSRTLGGVVVVYGVPGHTSRGKLRVAPGAIRFPDDLGRVKLTREHDRESIRGHLTSVEDDGQRLRVAFRVSDGPEGDAALAEAGDRTRDGLSFDIIDAELDGDTIVSGEAVAIGQVGIPAYGDGRVDTIAASNTTTTTERHPMTDEQRARLAELLAMNSRTAEEEAEFASLSQQAVTEAAQPAEGTDPPADPAPADPAPAVTASAAAYGVRPQGGARPPARTRTRTGAWAEFVRTVVASASGGASAITAALADVTHADHTSVIEPPAWSGELWSGVQYEPLWSDLFSTGDLTNWEGKGWRWITKLVMQDYAGNKVAIPTSTPDTEPSNYTSARMAVGVDIDRKFFDFKNQANEAFLNGLGEQARESWAIKLDGKVRAFALANAIAAEGVADPAPSLIKAAGYAIRALRRRQVIGRGGSAWVMVNDDDLFSLLDIDAHSVPAFLDLFGIDPKNFRSDQLVPAGTVLAGVKQAATVRTLPGSPLRFDAQNIANGGVDEAFFGYWAIEEHHTSGIAKTEYEAPAEA